MLRVESGDGDQCVRTQAFVAVLEHGATLEARIGCSEEVYGREQVSRGWMVSDRDGAVGSQNADRCPGHPASR